MKKKLIFQIPDSRFLDSYSSGYSLIEILVVLGLMGIFISLGISGWSNYRETRTLDEAGLEIVTYLRSIRSRAVNGKKPAAGCDLLEGWQVNDSLQASACCSNVECGLVGIKNFQPKVSVSKTFTGFPVYFESRTGKTDEEAEINMSYHNKSGTVSITDSGASIEWQRN